MFIQALRAVLTTDFITASGALRPCELLGGASDRIVSEVHGVNRVVLDVSSKTHATIELKEVNRYA